MHFRILEAKNGDCILISLKSEGKQRNLLIDGGPHAAYKRRAKKGDLYRALAEIKEKEERIDLLVLTHVDDDHIGGLLAGFKSDGLLTELVDKVWFNSGRLIHQSFDQDEDPSNLIEFDNVRTGTEADNKTSIGQGVRFEDFIAQKEIWDHPLIESGQVHDFYGAKMTILSPARANLEKLLGKWKREAPNSLTSADKKDYDQSFDELLVNDHFTGDSALHNGSSIAFLFDCDDARLLLLADAHDDVVQSSIRVLTDQSGNFYSEDNPLEVDYLKLSHHGSKYNTSPSFLRLVKANNFMVSTDGSKHGLPNKLTIARVAESQPGAVFLFNYPNVIEQMFLKEEQKQLNQNGYKFVGFRLVQL